MFVHASDPLFASKDTWSLTTFRFKELVYWVSMRTRRQNKDNTNDDDNEVK